MKTNKIWIFSLVVVVTMSLCNGFSLSRSAVVTNNKPIQSLFPSVSLHEKNAAAASSSNDEGSYTKIDYEALLYKYPVGLLGQTSLIYGFLTVIDKLLMRFSSSIPKVPFVLNFFFLYLFNLKSSSFSILPNQRSDGEEDRDFIKANKPSWTPPGLAFVFGWPLLTFGLRAYTASMIIDAMGGRYATLPIMSLMLHLGVGCLWNTSKLVEGRLGAPVILLYLLWLTKAFAAWQFYQIIPLAGKLLAVTLTWITAAVALETRTWQINPDPNTGKKDPLLPMQDPKGITKFRWE